MIREEYTALIIIVNIIVIIIAINIIVINQVTYRFFLPLQLY